MPEINPVPVRSRRTWRSLCWQTKLIVGTTSLVFWLVSLEIASRCYWSAAKGVPFHRSDEIWRVYYPEVAQSGVETTRPTRTDGTFDVLLLGGSVLDPAFGTIASKLETRLASKVGSKVRIFNMSKLGRNTRDSLWKYRRTNGAAFDLVIVYHGINDAYMNNCPRSVFLSDYSHAVWYAKVKMLDEHPEISWLCFPYTFRYFCVHFAEKARIRPGPRREWHAHGADIKTEVTFRQNMEAILNIAERRQEPVLLSTFAFHVPADYTLSRFHERKLDYGNHVSPIEIWGSPNHVPETIQRHNSIIRYLARERPRLLFLDQETRIPKDGSHFDDICHLTQKGCDAFVENVISSLDADRIHLAAPRVDPLR